MSKKEDAGFQPTFQGSGPFGPGNFQETPNVGSPNFKDLPISNITNDFDEGVFSETPRIPGDAGTTVTLPFQPNVYQDGSDFYFEFTTAGVVFLPVANSSGATDKRWHNPWNDAWPFRPVMVDSSGGAARAINDADAFGGSTVRRPRLQLTNEEDHIIYLEVTYLKNDESIAGRKAGDGSYAGIRSQIPQLKTGQTYTDSTAGTDFSSHSHFIGDMNTISMSDNIGAPFGTSPNSGLTPYTYVPLIERNYYAAAAPEIKVVKQADSDTDDVFSVKHDSWRNTDLSRKFVWGTISFDDTTTPSTPIIEWWRYDCPTYMINNHMSDDNSNLDRNIPIDHANDYDTTDLTAPNATNTGLTGTV